MKKVDRNKNDNNKNKLYKCMMANTSATRQQATNYYLLAAQQEHGYKEG